MLNQDANVTVKTGGGKMTASIHGDIDHHNAFSIRSKIDEALLTDKPEILALNLSGVSFMDSSGLGLILGRLNKAETVGAVLTIEDPTPQIRKILDLAGIGRMITIETNHNE